MTHSPSAAAEAKGWRLERSMEIAGGLATAPGHITLCRIQKTLDCEEWVTHFFNSQDGGFHMGHYFASEQPAMVDFISRIRRGY